MQHYQIYKDGEVRATRLYLAGPMRGIPEFNFPVFAAAANRLRDYGFEVWSPAENDVTQDGFDPTKDKALEMSHYMKRDLPEVCASDAVAVLPGWEKSKGASLEVHVARQCGIPVIDAMTLEDVVRGRSIMEDVPPFTQAEAEVCDVSRHFAGQAMADLADLMRSSALPSDSSSRKDIPLARGCLDYFPAALAAVAALSSTGNRQHNPGEEMHWARSKSSDHADCILRHLVERGGVDSDGVGHTTKVAWRALALLQIELESGGAPMARGAKL